MAQPLIIYKWTCQLILRDHLYLFHWLACSKLSCDCFHRIAAILHLHNMCMSVIQTHFNVAPVCQNCGCSAIIVLSCTGLLMWLTNMPGFLDAPMGKYANQPHTRVLLPGYDIFPHIVYQILNRATALSDPLMPHFYDVRWLEQWLHRQSLIFRRFAIFSIAGEPFGWIQPLPFKNTNEIVMCPHTHIITL
jgi:hypothetical protein